MRSLSVARKSLSSLRPVSLKPNTAFDPLCVVKRWNSTENNHDEPDWSNYPVRGPTDWKTPQGKLRLEYLMLQTVQDKEMEEKMGEFMSLMLGRIKSYKESLNNSPWQVFGPVASLKITKIVVLFKILMDGELVEAWSGFMDYLDSRGYETTSQDISLVGNFVADWLGVNGNNNTTSNE